MFKRLIMIVAVAMFAVALAQNLRYSNSSARFQIDYPSNWVAREGVMGTTVFIAKPNPSGFSTNLNVIASRAPAGTTLKSVRGELVDQLSQIVTDFKLVSQQDSTLAGVSAIAILYTGRQGKYNLVWYQVLALRSGINYTVTFTAEATMYERDRVPLGTILGSFRFL